MFKIKSIGILKGRGESASRSPRYCGGGREPSGIDGVDDGLEDNDDDGEEDDCTFVG